MTEPAIRIPGSCWDISNAEQRPEQLAPGHMQSLWQGKGLDLSQRSSAGARHSGINHLQTCCSVFELIQASHF